MSSSKRSLGRSVGVLHDGAAKLAGVLIQAGVGKLSEETVLDRLKRIQVDEKFGSLLDTCGIEPLATKGDLEGDNTEAHLALAMCCDAVRDALNTLRGALADYSYHNQKYPAVERATSELSHALRSLVLQCIAMGAGSAKRRPRK